MVAWVNFDNIKNSKRNLFEKYVLTYFITYTEINSANVLGGSFEKTVIYNNLINEKSLSIIILYISCIRCSDPILYLGVEYNACSFGKNYPDHGRYKDPLLTKTLCTL